MTFDGTGILNWSRSNAAAAKVTRNIGLPILRDIHHPQIQLTFWLPKT